MLRTVFFGTPELAIPSLERAASVSRLLAVVTRPDRPRGRGLKPEPPPVKRWAEAHDVPVTQPEKLNDGTFETWLKDQRPDLCLMAAYGRLLKQPILDIPPLGWLNVHPSLLPRWRGPSPIQSAILAGDTVTGVTIMRVTLEMDAGDIVLQESVSIDPEETAGELTGRLAALGADLLERAIRMAEQGPLPAIPQDPGKVVYCRLFEKKDGRIVWSDPATRIHNLVRAANPWPTAFCLFRNELFKILKSSVEAVPATAEPGVITAVEKDRLLVATGEGTLAIRRAQLPGRKPLDMAAFLPGARIQPGERFLEAPVPGNTDGDAFR
ncbi:MAG TPA: methionyl-tRNA formyltransferase [Candidatus Hydrogenedentes bacterium]|nr:methionyl-tRNA formyltransferase [Candidatus Hydrogenedentota bacterium]